MWSCGFPLKKYISRSPGHLICIWKIGFFIQIIDDINTEQYQFLSIMEQKLTNQVLNQHYIILSVECPPVLSWCDTVAGWRVIRDSIRLSFSEQLHFLDPVSTILTQFLTILSKSQPDTHIMTKLLLLLSIIFSFVFSHPVPQQVSKIIFSNLQILLTLYNTWQGPNCNTLLGRSLPECQQRSGLTYGNFGEIWGEITVDVSSPILVVKEPLERKKKRKNKNKDSVWIKSDFDDWSFLFQDEWMFLNVWNYQHMKQVSHFFS